MPTKRIDLMSYPRLAHYQYFREMANPYVGITVNVDITAFFARTKAQGHPFFLSFLHAAVGAANQVPQLRQRLDEEGIVEWDRCCSSHTVARSDGTYAYCNLDCDQPLEAFLPYAMREQEKAASIGSIEETDTQNLFFVSTLPWVSYTQLVQPTPYPADSNPRITWGRYFGQAEQLLMPVTLLCHHALVDGRHLADYYHILAQRLDG